ncbi:MAG: bifunctional hydroxymethylpyrimidine kinase/phosphomethylpyrimidine kinase [Candidatus Tyrphobacter sp.]
MERRGGPITVPQAPVVLSIGTTESRNVAGVGRDIVVAAEYGCAVVTAVAAVSAQDERGVHLLHVLPSELLEAQLDALAPVRVGAVRVGALGSAANVMLVARRLETMAGVLAIVDPVFHASAGGALLESGAFTALRNELATLPNVLLAPNVAEAAALLGYDSIGRDQMEGAATELRERGAYGVLLKGGHLAGEPVDVLVTRDRIEAFAAPRIAAQMSGTGCTLAMAIACELALGRALREAVVAARAFVRAKMTGPAGGE